MKWSHLLQDRFRPRLDVIGIRDVENVDVEVQRLRKFLPEITYFRALLQHDLLQIHTIQFSHA